MSRISTWFLERLNVLPFTKAISYCLQQTTTTKILTTADSKELPLFNEFGKCLKRNARFCVSRTRQVTMQKPSQMQWATFTSGYFIRMEISPINIAPMRNILALNKFRSSNSAAYNNIDQYCGSAINNPKEHRNK